MVGSLSNVHMIVTGVLGIGRCLGHGVSITCGSLE